MSPLLIRRLVIVIFLGGIAGMIVGSIRDNNGMAVTFGLVTAVAAVGLILVTSVAPPESFRRRQPPATDETAAVDDEAAADVEGRITELVASGADEAAVRQLVQRAVEMGRGAVRRS